MAVETHTFPARPSARASHPCTSSSAVPRQYDRAALQPPRHARESSPTLEGAHNGGCGQETRLWLWPRHRSRYPSFRDSATRGARTHLPRGTATHGGQARHFPSCRLANPLAAPFLPLSIDDTTLSHRGTNTSHFCPMVTRLWDEHAKDVAMLTSPPSPCPCERDPARIDLDTPFPQEARRLPLARSPHQHQC